MNSEALGHFKQAMALYGQGKYAEAADAYGKGLEFEPEWADCMQGMGMAQLNAGMVDEAIATLQRVVELAPNDPTAFTGLSMAWVRKGNKEEAEDAQARARQLVFQQDNPGTAPPG